MEMLIVAAIFSDMCTDASIYTVFKDPNTSGSSTMANYCLLQTLPIIPARCRPDGL